MVRRLAMSLLMALLGLLSGWPSSTIARTQEASNRALAAATDVLARDVAAINIVVDDMDRALAFYRDVLTFTIVSDTEVMGEDYERLHGVFGVRMRVVTMQLGDELIELTEFLVPKGKPVPADSRSNDHWFQHIAIITSDMNRAYAHLRAHKVRHASTGPQLLPEWNKNAGGIRAFYFYDPDGHVLEILQFPPDKGHSKWRRQTPSGQLFLGIDHTAIVVSDTEASLRFYRDVLGMEVVGTSENHGPEQEHLNNVFGARVRITSIRPPAHTNARGPSIEFLEYLAPRDGRPYPRDARSNDLLSWQTTIQIDDIHRAAAAVNAQHVAWISPGVIEMRDGPMQPGNRMAALVRDPDGHMIRMIQR